MKASVENHQGPTTWMKPSFTSLVERHSLIIGILLMFLYTWTIDLSNSGMMPFKVPFVVGLTVGWGFIFVSLFMTWLTLGKDAMATLFKRFFHWRVNWKWYLAAIVLLPALQFVSVLLTAWLTEAPVDFSHPMVRDIVPLSTPLFVLVVPWLIFEILTNGEEMGWRGYVLPRLQTKYNALAASLILGVIWSVWHLPKFFGTGTSGGRSFFWFTVFCMAAAVLYTWMYNNTSGSLLLVTLFHAANNTAGMFLPVSLAATGGIASNWMTMLYVIAAILVTIFAGPARLSRTEDKQI
ncbi:MAG TPA: type II CAAX endopeptidase family protein [Anaerolineales bacterium]|nr:type II CAAX endopeptidase family protein [Anaerolineales bacterium]